MLTNQAQDGLQSPIPVYEDEKADNSRLFRASPSPTLTSYTSFQPKCELMMSPQPSYLSICDIEKSLRHGTDALPLESDALEWKASQTSRNRARMIRKKKVPKLRWDSNCCSDECFEKGLAQSPSHNTKAVLSSSVEGKRHSCSPKEETANTKKKKDNQVCIHRNHPQCEHQQQHRDWSNEYEDGCCHQKNTAVSLKTVDDEKQLSFMKMSEAEIRSEDTHASCQYHDGQYSEEPKEVEISQLSASLSVNKIPKKYFFLNFFFLPFLFYFH